jgi:hypothetical protein
MPRPSPIPRLSKWLYLAATVTLFTLPLAVLWGLFSAWSDPSQLASRFAQLPAATAFTPAKALLTAAIGAVMLPPALFLLAEMRHLFRGYAKGEVLTAQSADHIRRIGQFLVALAGLGVILPTLQGVALTADNPTGQRVLAITLTSDSIGFALAGGLLIVIGWAMAEAARAAEENASFI